ncbi:uncharacterized protein LOC131162651 [Malania oleifera]|uniref:uncharacterized protein LOC131162651 n=1 Tax=Malania oleifera TaxID=397392 RepID=UPI0025AE8241|nr:uncharacterized protein LOC131162651 [Malania oleifera]
MATNTTGIDIFDDPSHVFYLSNSNNPGIVLILNLLTETNYNTWSQSMVGFIDGTISKPSNTSSSEYRQWNRCNNMVKARLLNSLSNEIYASVLFRDFARDIWINLKEHFSQVNGPSMYHIEQEIHNLVQGNTSMATYFTRLKLLWDELSSL